MSKLVRESKVSCCEVALLWDRKEKRPLSEKMIHRVGRDFLWLEFDESAMNPLLLERDH